MSAPRVRITQTLLSSWLYLYKREDGGEADFLATLRREKKPPTAAMLDGQRFEGCVNAALDGAAVDPDHEWAKPIRQLARYLAGSQKQVTLFREIDVDGQPYLLHGVLDFLRAGIIYDTKFSKTYKVGKYLASPQTPMYFALCPEAYEFQYLICDGKWVYRESYRPADLEPIEVTIGHFAQFLKQYDLWDIFAEKWRVEN